MDAIINAALNPTKGEEIPSNQESWTYEEILSTTFKLVMPTDYYKKNETTGVWEDMSENETYMKMLLNNAEELKIVGIIRPNEEAVAQSISGTMGYTYALTEHIEKAVNASAIVAAQKANPEVDVFTGLPFKGKDFTEPTAEAKAEEVRKYIDTLSEAEKALLYAAVAVEMPKAQLDAAVAAQMAKLPNRAAKEAMLKQAFAAQGIPEETASKYISEMTDADVDKAIVDMLETVMKEQYAAQVKAQLENLTVPQLAGELVVYLDKASSEELASVYDNHLPALYSESSYEENESILGIFDIDSPSSINIYSATFEAKDEIAALIEQYNAGVSKEDKITYTDYIAIMMSSITTIINAISYILIAFVSISLIVSSIMIGIITYISVLERTKEIGVLRAIGASKKDVGRVFNAETLIVGFAAGLIGIGVTLALNIPINIIIKAITDIGGIATLPWQGGVALVLISMALTLVAGIFPAGIASNKDPVEALRSE